MSVPLSSKTGLNRDRAILLMGPTASGKTALAMALSRRLPVELISVDSALVYRGMDIGTAKPNAGEQARYPHHLIDILEPFESYSAAQFCHDAKALIAKVNAAGRIPLLVGGTMLYFRSLQQGLSPMPPANEAVRQQLETEAAERGWAAMHQQLQGLDPITAARLHPNDSQRIQRALEVQQLTGMPMSQWQAKAGDACECQFLKLAVWPEDRAILHQRIAARFELMMKAGFLDEVATLRARADMNSECSAARAVGYRQLWQHLDGQLLLSEAVERGIIATRQLAKRQITWLRSESGLQRVSGVEQALVPIGQLLSSY